MHVRLQQLLAPPSPAAAVANRDEWSLGKILDIYWLFAESGVIKHFYPKTIHLFL
jgi:hypothetical protein